MACPLRNSVPAGSESAGKISVNTATHGLVAAFAPVVSTVPRQANALAPQKSHLRFVNLIPMFLISLSVFSYVSYLDLLDSIINSRITSGQKPISVKDVLQREGSHGAPRVCIWRASHIRGHCSRRYGTPSGDEQSD